MPKDRLSAFSDGVIAIIITIMVLELKAPHEASWRALEPLAPTFLAYVLSFSYVAIYWHNHHHLLAAAHRVSGPILLANSNLLFWMSLVPFSTAWLSETHFASVPTIFYGASLLAPAIAYFLLSRLLIRTQALNPRISEAIAQDLKGKLSLALYAAGIGCGFFAPMGAIAIYGLVALAWLIPDRRIERFVGGEEPLP